MRRILVVGKADDFVGATGGRPCGGHHARKGPGGEPRFHLRRYKRLS